MLMVVVAQLGRASDCGSEGRGFKSHLPPFRNEDLFLANKSFLLPYRISVCPNFVSFYSDFI